MSRPVRKGIGLVWLPIAATFPRDRPSPFSSTLRSSLFHPSPCKPPAFPKPPSATQILIDTTAYSSCSLLSSSHRISTVTFPPHITFLHLTTSTPLPQATPSSTNPLSLSLSIPLSWTTSSFLLRAQSESLIFSTGQANESNRRAQADASVPSFSSPRLSSLRTPPCLPTLRPPSLLLAPLADLSTLPPRRLPSSPRALFESIGSTSETSATRSDTRISSSS